MSKGELIFLAMGGSVLSILAVAMVLVFALIMHTQTRIGRYFVQGALGRDYTLVMGTVVVIAIFVVVFNLLVDLAYAWLDPRVRYD